MIFKLSRKLIVSPFAFAHSWASKKKIPNLNKRKLKILNTESKNTRSNDFQIIFGISLVIDFIRLLSKNYKS